MHENLRILSMRTGICTIVFCSCIETQTAAYRRVIGRFNDLT